MRTRVERAHTKSSFHAVKRRYKPKEPRSSTGYAAVRTRNCWQLPSPFPLFRAPQERRLVSSFGLRVHAAATSPALPSSPTSTETRPLRFCFFSFDCLRFDWSSSDRFRCRSRRRGRFLLRFVLADSWRVRNCLGGFAPVLFHFLRFASHGFALLLLLRKESLGGLQHLCPLLCLKGRKYVYWREDTGISDFTKVFP